MLGDHYEALGVPATADPEQIRAAYLRLMREHHPDLRPGDRVSADTARRINAAYEVLGNHTRRAAYDRQRARRAGQPDRAPRPAPPSAGWTGPSGVSTGAPRARAQAYSAERAAFRQSFSVACLRIAVAVMVLGAILLLAFSPQ